jgi:hypothetical protein
MAVAWGGREELFNKFCRMETGYSSKNILNSTEPHNFEVAKMVFFYVMCILPRFKNNK